MNIQRRTQPTQHGNTGVRSTALDRAKIAEVDIRGASQFFLSHTPTPTDGADCGPHNFFPLHPSDRLIPASRTLGHSSAELLAVSNPIHSGILHGAVRFGFKLLPCPANEASNGPHDRFGVLKKCVGQFVERFRTADERTNEQMLALTGSVSVGESK